jgi:hypothetical protein
VCLYMDSERKEVQRHFGPRYPFSYGDYVVKILMGSIDRSFDGMDEKRKKGCILM